MKDHLSEMDSPTSYYGNCYTVYKLIHMQEPQVENKKLTAHGRKMTTEKIIYKNQKRKTRNRLIYLVGLHLLFIFGFVGLICVEYLISRNWGQSFYFSLISDVLFGAYILETLAAIKFKNRKMLITSITTLAISIGCKLGALIVVLQN